MFLELTWYLSNAIDVIDIVDTNIVVAWSVPIILHNAAYFPSGQNFVKISTNVNGIVTKHKTKSVKEKNEKKIDIGFVKVHNTFTYLKQLNLQ